MAYNPQKAVEYAHRWAFDRNPDFMNFSGLGGDCTNFVSQCLLAGGARMNYTADFGWYYRSPDDRAPAWTGVEFLYNFLIANASKQSNPLLEDSAGPFASEIPISGIKPGDVVQLSFIEGLYGHSLFVVETGAAPDERGVLIATHSNDSDYRPLSSYSYYEYRCLKIGAR